MKLLKLLILTLIILTFNSYLYAQDYYYYKGQQIQLTPNYQFVNLVVTNTFDESLLNNLGVNEYNFRDYSDKKIVKLEFSTQISSNADFQVKNDSLRALNGIISVNPYFTYNGHTFGTNDKLYVKLNQPSDTVQLQSLASSKNLTYLGQLPYMTEWYSLASTYTTEESTLDLAAYFYEIGNFAEVEPGFTGLFVIPEFPQQSNPPSPNGSLEECYTVNQPNGQLQWNLFNNPNGNELADINVCGAWDETLGAGVTVTVIDTGIWGPSNDFTTGIEYIIDPLNEMTNDFYCANAGIPEHGTLASGILGAHHNTGLIGGIAPGSTMIWVTTALGVTTFDQTAVSIGIQEAIDPPWSSKVINMSFANSGSPTSILEDALEAAIAADVILVAGTGNTGQAGIYQPANYPGVLAVGASNEDGTHFASSTYGPEIDLAAPGETTIPTTGFNNNQIETNFGFTSCATPHVSGIIALMRSINPSMGRDAIQNVIRRTAQKSTGGDILPGDLSDQPASGDSFNFYELWFSQLGPKNNFLGYGVPDATRCVLTAKEFETTNDVLDLHIRNSDKDYGKEPDNVTKTANFVIWDSPDIWIRNQFEYSYDHENPEFDGSDATVFVRVVNKSNRTVVSADNMRVKLYWSKFGGHGTTPKDQYWSGALEVNCNGQSVVVGDIVPATNGGNNGYLIPTLKPGEQAVVTFSWTVPNPDDFCGILPDFNNNEFSLLARIEGALDPLTEDSFTNVWTHTRNNNNVGWKHVEVVSSKPTPEPMTGSFLLMNHENQSKTISLEFFNEFEEPGKPIYEEAQITLELPQELKQQWDSGGNPGSNYTLSNDKIILDQDNSVITNLILQPGESYSAKLKFNFISDELTGKEDYVYHLVQRDISNDDIIYGKSFHIEKGNMSSIDADAGDDSEINKNESTMLNAQTIGESAEYNWYDSQGVYLGSGLSITVSPSFTEEYTLEVIRDNDGVTDSDNVTVDVNLFSLGTVAPNPATDEVTIQYLAEDASTAFMMFTELNTNIVNNFVINTQDSELDIDLSNFNSGMYVVSLVCNGIIIDSQTLLIE